MAAAAQEPVVRERPGCVLGIAFGILVLVSLVAWMFLPRTEPRDGLSLLQTWFGVQELPLDFELRDAQKLMGGEEVVQLVRTTAADEPRITKPPAPAAPGEARVDWSRLKSGAADQLPRSLLFVHYPEDRGKSELGRLFSEKLAVGTLDTIGEHGGQMILALGTLTLADSSPAFVIERRFEPGGTFKDIARVDLSKAEPGLMLSAEWSRSEPFSKDRLQSLLESFRRP